MTDRRRLEISLLALRLGVAAVFLVWTSDRLLNFDHNSRMIGHYYHVDVTQPMLLAIGLIELVIVLMFLGGVMKTFSYGAILLFHTVTTLASAWRLFPPYEVHQLLYFGSLPMLAACLALFLMRDKDTLLTLPFGR